MEVEYKELIERKVCSDCTGEEFLSKQIKDEGEKGECSFCGELEHACITLDDLADRIKMAFEVHYSRTPDQPDSLEYMMHWDEEDYTWERKGQQTIYAIMEAADISEDIARNVQTILEYCNFDREMAKMGIESEFSREAHYERYFPRDRRWVAEWLGFEEQIKSRARFYNRTAVEHLCKVFKHIDEMRTYGGRTIIKNVGPSTDITHLYRGRVFQSTKILKKALERPDLELSAPPSRNAVSGRMNANGISVFYGATSPEIVLAEVRPPVGSLVAIARFEIIRPVRLLDIAALGDVIESGSIFDPDYAYRLGRMIFLRTLSRRMSQAVMPDDQEMEYLPTQAIADYLSTEGEVPLDGFLYPSVQVGGDSVNAVLFHKASRCERLEIPDGTDITSKISMYEDGLEPGFSVIEAVPPAKDSSDNDKAEGKWGEYLDEDSDEGLVCDMREMTLRIDIDSLCVHKVNTVKIGAICNPVYRHRCEKHRNF